MSQKDEDKEQMWPPGTSWRRENELLPKKRSFVLWESELKAPTLRMKWKLMVSFSFPSISLPPFVTELSKMWKGVVARDVSSVAIFLRQTPKLLHLPHLVISFLAELLKDDKDKDAKRAATQAAFSRKFKKNSDFWVYEKKIRLVIRRAIKQQW